MNMVERIFDLMKSAKVSGAELTRAIGLSNGTVTQWKKGQQKPSTDAIVKIADYFGVTTDYLLRGKDQAINELMVTKEDMVRRATEELDKQQKKLILDSVNQFVKECLASGYLIPVSAIDDSALDARKGDA